MKGIVIVLFGLMTMAVSPLMAAGSDADFGISENSSSVRDPGAMLRSPVQTVSSPGQLLSDSQTERGSSRPIVAFTAFRFDSRYADLSVQPVLGRINGAQVRVNW
jgi:hypothetical protein